MARLYRAWDGPSAWGDLIMVGYLTAQCLDGVFTYLGITIWGLRIEANPILSSAVAMTGLGTGLLTAKLVAVSFGILLHLRRIHTLVAALTMFYLTVAILPWTALFLAL